MHLITALSLWSGHILRNMEEFYNSQTSPSEGPGSTSTNRLSRMLPMPHFELLGKRRTLVTLYQEVQTSRSTPEPNDAPEEWTRWEVLFRRLKTLNPRRKVWGYKPLYPYGQTWARRLDPLRDKLKVWSDSSEFRARKQDVEIKQDSSRLE